MNYKQELFIINLWVDYGCRLDFEEFRNKIITGKYYIRVYHDGYYLSYSAWSKFDTDKTTKIVVKGSENELDISKETLQKLHSLLIWGRYNNTNPFKLIPIT